MIQIFDKNIMGKIVKSPITIIHFYGGEAHLKNVENSNPVGVLVTGANMDELVTAALVADVAHQKGNPFTLLLPYLPAARADRGSPFGAKVYADMINTMNAQKVVCVDPHSPIMPTLVNNLKILNIVPIITSALGTQTYSGIISPDEGSRERSTVVAESLGLPIVKAYKKRDFETGKLSGFNCDPLPVLNGKYLVVDDVCDGGGTFLGLADIIKIPKEKLSLWVTHGVFNNNAFKLLEKFETVYTTNSHPGAANPDVKANIINIIPSLTINII